MAVGLPAEPQKSLITLPDEIQLAILADLTINDLKFLSSTCHLYRRLLVPYIFQHLKLREDAESGAAVKALIKKGYAVHVKSLRFVAHADEDDDVETSEPGTREERSDRDVQSQNRQEVDGKRAEADEGEEGVNSCEGVEGDIKAEDDSNVPHEGSDIAESDENMNVNDDEGSVNEEARNLLSSQSSDILSHLSRFAHLETLSIEFDFDIAEWGESIHIFMDEETEPEHKMAERWTQWRKLMLRTFEAVTRNVRATFPKLEILNLPPATVSHYMSQGFKNFLSGLKYFKLNLFGGHNGAGWNINTQFGWQAFIPKLRNHFFDHLQNAETVCLEAHERGPIGSEGANHADSPFRIGQMPQLRSLTLDNCFIDPWLMDVIAQQLKAGKLEELRLQHCHCSMTAYYQVTVQKKVVWADFFKGLLAARPRSLKKLEIIDEGVYPNLQGVRIVEDSDDEEDDEVTEIKAILEDQKDQGRRLFSYVSLDSKYGMVFASDIDNRERFLDGKDQEAYNDLMAVVKENASRV